MGTSTSSKGANKKSSLVPSWANDNNEPVPNIERDLVGLGQNLVGLPQDKLAITLKERWGIMPKMQRADDWLALNAIKQSLKLVVDYLTYYKISKRATLI